VEPRPEIREKSPNASGLSAFAVTASFNASSALNAINVGARQDCAEF
jgi:hypothetical protein